MRSRRKTEAGGAVRNQLALIDARPFRTARERLAFIRARIDQVREERALRSRGRRRRATSPPPSQLGLFGEVTGD